MDLAILVRHLKLSQHARLFEMHDKVVLMNLRQENKSHCCHNCRNIHLAILIGDRLDGDSILWLEFHPILIAHGLVLRERYRSILRHIRLVEEFAES